MNFLARNPWLVIMAMALGLPLGMLAKRLREWRGAARRRREQAAAETVVENRWQVAQAQLDDMMREAFLTAKAEAKRDQLEAAKRCGCADCRDYLQRQTSGQQ